MYLADDESYDESKVLKCDEIPSDWEDYYANYRTLFNNNLKCVGALIETKINEFPTEVQDKLNALFMEYNDAIDEARSHLLALIDVLYTNPTGSNCFDKTLYTTYISSYNIAKDLLLEINILLTTGGDVIAIQPNIGVDTSIVYPTTGSTKVTKCVGVYMKQMDFGSEFIGSVSIMSTEPVGTTWAPAAPRGDGEWIRR